jgi:hypothetical protein
MAVRHGSEAVCLACRGYDQRTVLQVGIEGRDVWKSRRLRSHGIFALLNGADSLAAPDVGG